MSKIIVFLFLSTIGFFSCKNNEKETGQIEIAKKYFEALDQSNSSEMKALLTDSLVTVIPKHAYEVKFSRNDYVEKWLKWDSIFEPTYKILEIELNSEIVIATISKTDKRILFLMKEPFLTKEVLKFENGKIISIETEYLNFDEATWEMNKNGLLNWIEKNHPELDGFIYDQTESGGLKFLKAVELYENKNNVPKKCATGNKVVSNASESNSI